MADRARPRRGLRDGAAQGRRANCGGSQRSTCRMSRARASPGTARRRSRPSGRSAGRTSRSSPSPSPQLDHDPTAKGWQILGPGPLPAVAAGLISRVAVRSWPLLRSWTMTKQRATLPRVLRLPGRGRRPPWLEKAFGFETTMQAPGRQGRDHARRAAVRDGSPSPCSPTRSATTGRPQGRHRRSGSYSYWAPRRRSTRCTPPRLRPAPSRSGSRSHRVGQLPLPGRRPRGLRVDVRHARARATRRRMVRRIDCRNSHPARRPVKE